MRIIPRQIMKKADKEACEKIIKKSNENLDNGMMIAKRLGYNWVILQDFIDKKGFWKE